LTQTQLTKREAGEVLQLLGALMHRMRGRGEPSLPEPLRAAFAAGSLRPRHMPPLFALAMGGPASVGELAERVDLAPTTTSLLVNELNRAGLVERKEDDRDRRRTIVAVSEHIRGPLVELASTRIAMVQRALGQLDPDARAHFVQGLRALVEEMQ
jgi:DNA-binding MarR family transcriptional regulator